MPIDSAHKRKIISSITVDARNCRFSLRQDGQKIRMSLVLENEYLKSEFNGNYDLDSSELTFYHPIHFHNRMDAMLWFEREIKRVKSETGLGFDVIGGGYKFSWFNGYLTIRDEIEFLYISPVEIL